MNFVFRMVCLLLATVAAGSEEGPQTVKQKPRVSLITSLYDGDEFIEGFLADVSRETIFPECELIIINANSPGHEEPVIKKYMAQYPNIIYERLTFDPGIYAVWNIAIKKASADFIANANVDDRRCPESLALQVQALEADDKLDLVYSDHLISSIANETFEEAYSKFQAHTQLWCNPGEFSSERMRLCLPGPQPVWRKSLHDRCGLFSESYFSSGDFEMWNRAVSHGCLFKKIPGFSGVFYNGQRGLSTRPNSRKLIEDQSIVSAYGYLWNGLAGKPPRLLIQVCSRNNQKALFQALDLYYRNLSGKIAYHILVTLDDEDVVMHAPETVEKLKTYPNLSFYFGRWGPPEEVCYRDIKLYQDYDVLVLARDNPLWIPVAYDKKITDTYLASFPNYDGVFVLETTALPKQEDLIVIGKNFLDQFGVDLSSNPVAVHRGKL